MAEHEININLNDAARQTFDPQGNPTGSTGIPTADPAVFQAYQQIVDRFEEIISNSPEVAQADQRRAEREEMTSIFFPKESVERPTQDSSQQEPETESRPRRRRPRPGNAPENNVTDPVEEYIIDRMNQPPVTPPPNGPTGGGSGVNPGSPTGGATGGGVVAPGRDGGGGGNGGEPPDMPNGAAAAAALPIAAMLGPAGVGVIVAAGLIEGLMLIGEGLMHSIDALDDTMHSVVDDIKAFSPEVASASAGAGIADLMIRMDRAVELGPDIARWLETRTEIDMVLGRTATELTRDLMPLIQKISEGVLDGVTLLSLASEDIMPVLMAVLTENPLARALEVTGITADLKAIVHSAREAVRIAREQKLRELEKNAGQIGGNFEAWLQLQALPVNGVPNLQNQQAQFQPVVMGGGLN